MGDVASAPRVVDAEYDAEYVGGAEAGMRR
jgi:hypothetical protein